MATQDNEILTSIHGKEIGLNANRDLVVGGKTITNKSAEVGAKNGSTVVETVLVDGPVRKVKLTCTATPLDFTDEGGQGQHAGVKVYDFPTGLLLFFGGVIDGSLTLTDDAGTWTATYNGDVSVGTALNADAQGLDTTAVDLIQATALTQAIALVANCDAVTIASALTESGARWHDGTATAKDMFLNFEIDDAVGHAGDPGTFTGTIEFAYMILGDN